MSGLKKYSTWQTIWLVALRVAIGWHFLYEGLYKLIKSGWTSKHYLTDSSGWFSDIFADMANSPTALAIVDSANIWGLVLIGTSLIVGCLSRYAAIAGAVVLLLFYISHIPFIGATYMAPVEGNYLWFDKNVVEIFALLVTIVLPSSHIIGIDRFIGKLRNAKA